VGPSGVSPQTPGVASLGLRPLHQLEDMRTRKERRFERSGLSAGLVDRDKKSGVLGGYPQTPRVCFAWDFVCLGSSECLCPLNEYVKCDL
jgi:hypothetical protein